MSIVDEGVGQTWNDCNKEKLHRSEENPEANIYNPGDSYDIDMCMEGGGGNECAQFKYIPRRNRAALLVRVVVVKIFSLCVCNWYQLFKRLF